MGDARNIRCLDRDVEGNDWKRLVETLLRAIKKDLARYANKGKKLTPELYEAMYHVVLAAESCSVDDGAPRRLEFCAKALFKSIYETLNLLTGRETSAHIRGLDHGDETKKIGRSYVRILLKLLESREYYAEELSARRCGNLLMLFFEILCQQNNSSTAINDEGSEKKDICLNEKITK